MSTLYTHCAQCSTMGLTRVTLQYKILHLWERQHKGKIRECQSCCSKWYCCNTVLLLWCTLKIPQQRYWLCLIFLCVSAHLIHGLLFWRCGQTCLALQASLWIVRLSDLFCAGFSRGRKKRKRENVEGKEVCVCLCVCHQIIKKCQVMSAGSLMWVWWGPPPPVPFPLVLISQVDEHISSSPNPSPCIPPHMSTMHTDRHTCVTTAHVRESRVTWCTGPQWKSNNNKKKSVV